MRPQLAVVNTDLLDPIILGLSTAVSETTTEGVHLAVVAEISRAIIRENLRSRGDIGLDAGAISGTEQGKCEGRGWKSELHGDFRVCEP